MTLPPTERLFKKGAIFTVTLGTMDLAQTETTQNGMGNGTYDYRGGTFDVSRDGGSGLRLSNGSNSTALDTLVVGRRRHRENLLFTTLPIIKDTSAPLIWSLMRTLVSPTAWQTRTTRTVSQKAYRSPSFTTKMAACDRSKSLKR